MKDQIGAVPDGFTSDDHDEEKLSPADVPKVLDFLEQAGAGIPQIDPDEVT